MNIPISAEHEQTVIAGMMNNKACYYDAMSELSSNHFADENAQQIYHELSKSEGMVSANTLMKNISDPRLKSAIRTFDSNWSNQEDFNQSLKKVKDTHLKRELFYTLNKVTKNFNDTPGEDLIATLQNEIGNLSYDDNEENMIFPEDRAIIALEEWRERYKNPDLAKGLPYSRVNDKGREVGFPSLDKAFHGAHGGDLIMIAAKTGEGKTAFAVNLARHLSYDLDHWGYYMNTEMRIKEMEARILAPIAEVTANEFMRGILTGTKAEQERKNERIENSHRFLQSSKLVISRIPDLPLHKAKGLANQVKAKQPKLEYLIIDYVGRMEIKDFNGNGWDELYQITKQLKELAIRLNIPVFMLAQRNQAGDVEGAKKMMNECDGVLYFEPITEEDDKDIRQRTNEVSASLINYKIVKKKVRRDDNPYPIYVLFDKSRNFINEMG